MPRLGTDDDAHRNNTTNRRPLHIPVGSNSMATAYAANNHEPSSRLTGILFILAITFILKNVLFHQYALDETNNVQKMKHDIAYLLQAVQEANEKAIKEVAQKFLQAKIEKEVAIKSAKQQIAEANSKLAQTELTLQEALQKISNLEKEAFPLSVWKSTGTKFVSHSDKNSRLYDVLNCAPLKSGTFEWKIQVHSAYSYHLLLGVIGSSLKLPLDNWIGWTKKTWGYQSHYGDASYWNDGRKVISNLPKYTAGSVVHFVLDLTNEGTLCVSVDGSPLVQLFSNMKYFIDKDEGFLPATSMQGNNKIELLEFKSLPIDISSVMIQKTLYS